MNKQVNQNHYGHGQLQFWGFSHCAYGGWFSVILLRSGLAFWVCATWAIPVPCWVSWLLVCWMQLVAPMIPSFSMCFFEVKTRSDCPLPLTNVVTAKAISTAGCSVCPKHLCCSKQCCSKRMVVQIAGTSRPSSHCSDL